MFVFVKIAVCYFQCLEYMPKTMRTFTAEMGSFACNQAHIGQALMQMAKPRGPMIHPMQLLLGFKSHTLFGSREIVDVLHSAGFSVSYDEICRFQRCAAVTSEDLDQAVDTYIQLCAHFVFHPISLLSHF